MHYKSIEDLNADARELTHQDGVDFDAVVGIPRSGLLAANLVCLHDDVPMTDVDGLCNQRLLATGRRIDEDGSFDDVDSVLVLDDSVLSGTQMTETRQRIERQDFPFEIEYAAIYISPWGHKYVDHWSRVVPTPRTFEWNVMHHPLLENACVDIDGVLCRDPTPNENDDGDRYREFLTGVEPNVVPNKRIAHLVTARLEKYRHETEAWLDKHGIEYETLTMMDLPTMEARRELGTHAEFKSKVYKSTDTVLFIESNQTQAAEIRQRTGKPVLCYETNQLLQPGLKDRVYNNTAGSVSEFKNAPLTFLAEESLSLGYRGIHAARQKVQNLTGSGK